LPANLFTNQLVTVEGWVKWRAFTDYSRFFDILDAALHINVHTGRSNNTMVLEQWSPGFQNLKSIQVPGGFGRNEWVHLAAVAGKDVAKLYINGRLTSTNATPDSFRPRTSPRPGNFLGRSGMKGVLNAGLDPDLDGCMAEVRLWAGERTAEQIQANRFLGLSGTEPGLLALWNFADGTVRDASGNGRDGRLMGTAAVVPASRTATASTVSAENVLSLDGCSGYVELPPNIFDDLNEATVEAWVKWDRLDGPGWKRVFNYGAAMHDLGIGVQGGDTLWFVLINSEGTFHEVKAPNTLKPGDWVHVAAVTGSGGMRVT
jgi:hypothetical protein